MSALDVQGMVLAGLGRSAGPFLLLGFDPVGAEAPPTPPPAKPRLPVPPPIGPKTGACPERHCAPFWVATRSHTARCPEGYTGASVTVTRSFTSYLSLNHAEQQAAALAKRDATAQLHCTKI